MRFPRRRTLALAAGAAAATVALSGCHVNPELACGAWMRDGHRLAQAYWSFQTDRYECLSISPRGNRDRYGVIEIHLPNGEIRTLRHESP